MSNEEITFHWSRNHGDCYDCGRPAAFWCPEMYGTVESEPRVENKFCAVCAANHAADGESVRWIADPYAAANDDDDDGQSRQCTTWIEQEVWK